jgi:hypothetical protein
MTVPLYLLEKIARHGSAAQRLIDERKRGEGEHSGKDDGDAIAFDAADFVLTFLGLCGDEAVLETRELRNNVAQLIGSAIQEHKLRQESEGRFALFENDGSRLTASEYDETPEARNSCQFTCRKVFGVRSLTAFKRENSTRAGSTRRSPWNCRSSRTGLLTASSVLLPNVVLRTCTSVSRLMQSR